MDAMDVAQRYFDALNERDWEGLDAILSRNVSFSVVPYGKTVRGAAAVVNGSRMQGQGLPDFHNRTVDWVAHGDRAIVETVTTYTLTVPWDPEIPGLEPVYPGGLTVVRPGCFVFELRRGRIIRIANYHDRLSVARHISGGQAQN